MRQYGNILPKLLLPTCWWFWHPLLAWINDFADCVLPSVSLGTLHIRNLSHLHAQSVWCNRTIIQFELLIRCMNNILIFSAKVAHLVVPFFAHAPSFSIFCVCSKLSASNMINLAELSITDYKVWNSKHLPIKNTFNNTSITITTLWIHYLLVMSHATHTMP